MFKYLRASWSSSKAKRLLKRKKLSTGFCSDTQRPSEKKNQETGRALCTWPETLDHHKGKASHLLPNCGSIREIDHKRNKEEWKTFASFKVISLFLGYSLLLQDALLWLAQSIKRLQASLFFMMSPRHLCWPKKDRFAIINTLASWFSPEASDRRQQYLSGDVAGSRHTISWIKTTFFLFFYELSPHIGSFPLRSRLCSWHFLLCWVPSHWIKSLLLKSLQRNWSRQFCVFLTYWQSHSFSRRGVNKP